MRLNDPMEFTMTIEDADLEVMAKVLNDIKIPECPYFDISDKYGNEARYYRENRWIPCSERLPEEDEEVLVSVHFMGLKQTHPNGWNDHIKPNYYVEIASHIDGEWSSDSDEYKVARSRHKVIAWMPLPKPYGGEQE